MVQSAAQDMRVAKTTDFRFVVEKDPDHVVLKLDTLEDQADVYLTKGQLERLVQEAELAVEKLECREKLPDVS